MDNANISLVVIVAIFWGWAIFQARQRNRRWFPNYVIVPLFFILLGVSINNRFHSEVGTYIILGAHAVLLVLLLVVRIRRRKA